MPRKGVSQIYMEARGMKKGKHTAYIAVIFILLTLFLLFSGLDISADNRGTLILLGNEDLPPIIYNENGIAKGVAVDIAMAIGESIDYDIKVIAMNWEQAQEMVLNDEADGLLQINPSPQRNEIYDFSAPLLKSNFSIFVKNNKTSIKNVNDLEGKIVGVEPGGYPYILLQSCKDTIIEKIYDWEIAFKGLGSGDLDAIIVDRWIGEYELANSKISDIKIVSPPIEIQYSRIAVRKGDSETLTLINNGLKKITNDGTVDRIMKGWQGERVVYITENHFQTLFLRSLIVFLLIVALIAIYFVRKYKKLSNKFEGNVKKSTEELSHTNEMLKLANLKLEQISMIDGLTSIGNRRAFDIAYSKAWEISVREKMPYL